MQGLKVLTAVVVVIFAGRFADRRIFRAVANSKLRELFTAAALLLVLGTTALMNAVGLSPALGAFLAGVVLADSEYRHQLEVDLEPFKGLLLGVFFISVGVGIDFTQMGEKPGLTAALVLSILLLKGVVLWTVGRIGALQKPDKFILALGLSQVGEFAFVLIKFSTEQAILDSSLGRLFSSVVALTMVATPIALAIYFRYFEPNLQVQKEQRPEEEVEEKDNPVIVAGYGRFGQTATRLLRSAGFGCTVLDYDADQVEMLRGFGMKSYFGDASRIDFLRSAGADQAKLIVLATDNFEQMPGWVEEIKKEFPHLKILARSFDRIHAYEMLHRGVDHIYIETSGSAINLGIDALRELGMQAKHAFKLGMLFQKHNNQSIRDLSKAYKESDESTYISQARLSLEQLEKMLKHDAIDMMGPHDIREEEYTDSYPG
jgi:voltage-gated potassium channel Kch